MKYTPLTTSALTLALLMGSALPALAEDSIQGDASVGTTATVQGEHEDNGDFPGARFLGGLKTRLQKSENDDQGEHLDASTSEKMKADREDKHMQKRQEKGSSEIDKRIESLTNLKNRLASIKLLDATALATISANLDAEIAKLQALKTQIQSDTSTTTLKDDVKSITQGLRIFAVVEPKARIAASASRINAVVTQLSALTTKLQARIDTAKTAGVDTTAAVAALADLQAKSADAKVQADAAVALTVNLAPDNGDATIRATNLQALKDAKAKLVLAQKDLADARHDAATVRGVVKGSGGSDHASTTPGHQ
jgi:hypothetical protein